MIQFWRILRRLLFLFVTVVFASNTIAYFVLNNRYVHEWIVSQANEKFFSSRGLELQLGTISLNFLETKLAVRDIQITEISSQRSQLLSAETVTLGFDPWRPSRAWLPRTRYIDIHKWLVDVRLGEFLQDGSKEQGKVDLNGILSEAQPFLGQKVELTEGTVVRRSVSTETLNAKIRKLFLKYNSEKSKDGITVLIDTDKSSFCISEVEPCQKTIPIDDLSLTAVYSSEGVIRVERLQARGYYGTWGAVGELKLDAQAKIQNYQFNLNGESNAKQWFDLAHLQGRGQFSTSLKVVPSSSTNSENVAVTTPMFSGKVAWNNLHLNGYDIYTGQADVTYDDRVISYRNADITTYTGAKIEAYGKYVLRDKMPYENHARLKNFPFIELMSGLGIQTEAINFKMNSENLLVDGELSPDGERGFTLRAKGKIGANALLIPGFESQKYSLPDCLVDLNLNTDTNRMTFKGSSLTCDNKDIEQPAEFVLQKGLIDYRKSTNEFNFTGSYAPASIISYFVERDIAGSMDLRASITSSPGRLVVFRSEVQVNDGKIFGLRVPRLSGTIELDKNEFRGMDLEGWLDEEMQQPNVRAKFVKVGFKNRSLELDAKFDGKTTELMSIFGDAGRKASKGVEGWAELSKLKIKGSYRNLADAALDARIRLKNLVSSHVSARDLQATISCQNGWCSGSRAFAQDIAFGSARINRIKNSEGRNLSTLQSKAIVEVDSISERSVSLRTDFQSVPFIFSGGDSQNISGKFDLRGNLQGGKKDWEMSASARVDSLALGDTPLGSVVATASSHSAGPINVILSGIFDQIQARVVFDHALEKSSQLYLSMRTFEMFKYLHFLNIGDLRTTGSVTAEFSVDGPGLKPLMRSSESVLEQLSLRGQLSKSLVQIGNAGFTLRDPVSLAMDGGVFTFSPTVLRGNAGEFRTSGRYSVADEVLSARVESDIDASILAGILPSITQANGQVSLRGQVNTDSDGSRFRGEARVENVFLSGKYLSPPLTGANGRVLFQDSRIEIPALTASKGNGQIDVVGTIDLQSDKERSIGEQEPSVALRANVRSAQFRWPQDIFETVETTLDGQLELVGRGRPYLLNGDVKISKGRAFRDVTCQELMRVGSQSSSEKSISNPIKPFVQLNMGIEADNSFTLQTSCIRGRVSTALKVTGSDAEPVIAGQIRLDNGQLTLLKTRFDVTRADATFDNLVRIEPRLDAQMVAKIDKYSVFVGAEGPLSRPRLNIWSDPSTGPDGTPLSRPVLIRMISTNRGPSETTQTAVTQALANGVVGLFDDPLSQAVSRITRGFVDRFELQPILDSGQSSWRARVSRDLGEKFNLGLDFEPNSQSLTGEIFINESVNVLGGFDRRSSQIGTYSELKGGFRFQFGGK